jgi:TetR/AcrR family transcriptional repressor of nem operon
MPRVREFDPEQALEAAMGVFWEKGYSATSVEDLVEATGVNRYGLYDVYESKHGLFLAALQHYRRTVISRAIFELERPGAGLDAIHAVFERILERVRSGEGKLGCLLCNTAEEVAPLDMDAAREVSAFQRRLVKAFSGAVAVAQQRGDLATETDAAKLGRFLAGLIQGASYLARSPAGPRAVEDFVRVGLRVLG